MEESTYRSLIDEKVTDWESSLAKLRTQADTASSDTRVKLVEMIEKFRTEIDSAKARLIDLDEQETKDNTLEIKNKILHVFNSIDKEFKGYEDVTPFML